MITYGAPQEMLDEEDDFKNSCKNTTKCYCGHTTMCDCVDMLELGQIVEKETKQRLEKYSERFDYDKSPIGNPDTWGKRMLFSEDGVLEFTEWKDENFLMYRDKTYYAKTSSPYFDVTKYVGKEKPTKHYTSKELLEIFKKQKEL